MNRRWGALLVISLLALACGPLGALTRPEELQQTAEALVVTAQAIATEPPKLVETVQAVITEQPELTETVELEATSAPPGGGGMIRQWAVMASASSAFGDPSWSAQQATGAPDTLECGDIGTAWAASSSDTAEWLEVTFARSVIPTEIHIYQTYTPDQVVRVELIDIAGGYTEVYTGQPVDRSSGPCPYVLSIPVETNLEANALRITIDQSQLQDWNEIDAVELVGRAPGE